MGGERESDIFWFYEKYGAKAKENKISGFASFGSV